MWEPQYQLCSSHPAPLQTRGRFLKRREKLHKERSGGQFDTNRQWKYFILLPSYTLLVFLCAKPLPDYTVSVRDQFTTSRNNIWGEAPICMNLLSRYGEEMLDVIVIAGLKEQ